MAAQRRRRGSATSQLPGVFDVPGVGLSRGPVGSRQDVTLSDLQAEEDRFEHELLVWLHSVLVDPGYFYMIYRLVWPVLFVFIVLMAVDGCADLEGAEGSRFVDTAAPPDTTPVTLAEAVCFHVAELRSNYGFVWTGAVGQTLLGTAMVSFTLVPLPRQLVIQLAAAGFVALGLLSVFSNVTPLFYNDARGNEEPEDTQCRMELTTKTFPYGLQWVMIVAQAGFNAIVVTAGGLVSISHERWQLESLLHMRRVRRLLEQTTEFAATVMARQQEEAARKTMEATLGYAAHELRNPLFVIANVAEGLTERLQETILQAESAAAGAESAAAGASPSNPLPDRSPFAAADRVPVPPARSGVHVGTGAALDVLEGLRDVESDMQIVSEAVANMRRVTDDVLDHQKLHTGKLELIPRLVSTEKVVRQVARRYAAKSCENTSSLLRRLAAEQVMAAVQRASGAGSPSEGDAQKGPTVLLDGIPVFMDSEVPAQLLVDGLRLQQLLSNGLSNAVKNVRGIDHMAEVDDDLDDEEGDATDEEVPPYGAPEVGLPPKALSRRLRGSILGGTPRHGRRQGPWQLHAGLGGVWLEVRIVRRQAVSQGGMQRTNTKDMAAIADPSHPQHSSSPSHPAASSHGGDSAGRRLAEAGGLSRLQSTGEVRASGRSHVQDGILRYWTGVSSIDPLVFRAHDQEVSLPSLSSSVSHSALTKSYLSVSVYNTSFGGLGGVDVAKLFRPFEQGVGPGRTITKGTGLGLPICRLLARLMGGGVGLTEVRQRPADQGSARASATGISAAVNSSVASPDVGMHAGAARMRSTASGRSTPLKMHALLGRQTAEKDALARFSSSNAPYAVARQHPGIGSMATIGAMVACDTQTSDPGDSDTPVPAESSAHAASPAPGRPLAVHVRSGRLRGAAGFRFNGRLDDDKRPLIRGRDGGVGSVEDPHCRLGWSTRTWARLGRALRARFGTAHQWKQTDQFVMDDQPAQSFEAANRRQSADSQQQRLGIKTRSHAASAAVYDGLRRSSTTDRTATHLGAGGGMHRHRSSVSDLIITRATPDLDPAGQFALTSDCRRLVQQALAADLTVTCFTVEVEVEMAPESPDGSSQVLDASRSSSSRSRVLAVIQRGSDRETASLQTALSIPGGLRHASDSPPSQVGGVFPQGPHSQRSVQPDVSPMMAAPPSPAGKRQAASRPASLPAAPLPSHGPRELPLAIVDDERLNRMVLKRLVGRLRVPVAGGGSKRAKLVQELTDGSDIEPSMVSGCGLPTGEVAQVVLMDLNMQHESGIDAAARLRHAGCTACIVACTGDVVTEEQLVDRPVEMDDSGKLLEPASRSAIAVGDFSMQPFDAVLTKPFDVKGLQRAVLRGLAHSSWAWAPVEPEALYSIGE